MEGQSGARGGGEGAEGEEDTKWEKWIRGLKTGVDRECRISRWGPDCLGEVYIPEKFEGKSQCYERGRSMGGISRSQSCQEF